MSVSVNELATLIWHQPQYLNMAQLQTFPDISFCISFQYALIRVFIVLKHNVMTCEQAWPRGRYSQNSPLEISF